MGWSYTAGQKGVNRVTVYERPDGSSIFVSYMEDGKRRRRSLAKVIGQPILDRGLAARAAERLATRFKALQDSGSQALLQEKETKAIRVNAIATMTDREILARRLPTAPLVGVYLLLDGDEVAYVGQSTDVMHRLAAHRRRPPTAFSDCAFVAVDPEDLDEVEYILIRRYGARGNIRRSVP